MADKIPLKQLNQDPAKGSNKFKACLEFSTDPSALTIFLFCILDRIGTESLFHLNRCSFCLALQFMSFSERVAGLKINVIHRVGKQADAPEVCTDGKHTGIKSANSTTHSSCAL